MNAKKKLLFLIFVLPVAAMFTGCAGFYVGGGASYVNGGGEQASYRGISNNLIILPKMNPAIGYYAEIGKIGRDGTIQISYVNAKLEGENSGKKYECAYNKITAGGRFFFERMSDEIGFYAPINLSMSFINIPGASGQEAVTYSGLGIEGGLGMRVPLGEAFMINIDAMWVIDTLGSASTKAASGKLEESMWLMGPALRAGAFFIFD